MPADGVVIAKEAVRLGEQSQAHQGEEVARYLIHAHSTNLQFAPVSSTSSRDARRTEPRRPSGCMTSTSTCQSRSEAGHLQIAIQYLLLL
jgi:hypothetical protein